MQTQQELDTDKMGEETGWMDEGPVGLSLKPLLHPQDNSSMGQLIPLLVNPVFVWLFSFLQLKRKRLIQRPQFSFSGFVF